MSEFWIALYINCIYGSFVPRGPFESESAAFDFIRTRPENEKPLWDAIKVEAADV